MKKAKWILLGLLALLVVAGVVVFVNLNSIVRSTVEKQSAASLKVPTTLGGATLSVFSGDVSLRNFEVGSPEGYKAPQMLSLGGLDVNTSWAGIRSDPLKVDTIAIDKPKLVLEMSGTNLNIKKFIDNLPKGSEPEPTPAGEEKPMKLIINNLSVTGAQVVFRPDLAALSSLPGGFADKVKPEYNLTIPDLTIANIGTGEGNQNGAAVKEIVTRLITTLAGKAAESPDLPPELRAVLSGDLSNVANMLKEKGMAEAQKQLGKVTEDLKAKIGDELGSKVGDVLKNPDVTKDPGKAVGDLLGGFGGKKDATTKPAP